MIGLVVLILPLFLGGVIGFILARRAANGGRTIVKPLIEYVVLVGGIALVLALAFAGQMDTQDSEASVRKVLNYALLQFGLMSLLALPATLFAWRDRKGRE